MQVNSNSGSVQVAKATASAVVSQPVVGSSTAIATGEMVSISAEAMELLKEELENGGGNEPPTTNTGGTGIEPPKGESQTGGTGIEPPPVNSNDTGGTGIEPPSGV